MKREARIRVIRDAFLNMMNLLNKMDRLELVLQF